MNNLKIVIAEDKDSREIIRMLKQIAQWMKDSGIDQWGFLLQGGDDEEIKQAISNQETYKVLHNNELIGTFSLLENQSEWDLHIWGEDSSENSLYLHRLAVVPEYMKHGIGTYILTWMENHFSNEKVFLRLDCVADNKKLNSFYKVNGFELVGENDGHSKYQKRL
ncbi:GNAT family N-acetyltransferase [Radiobacillus kanasensis]|uniref:GNAT family N-acetyltransferase n=1 Tax=Radiobacillus kanasensis TaxID=2844358 RepID=UPI001E450FEB|nr:GNAT family N-acetyltransferase [Radiobacillus kanasensis]UFU00099.1 GNAT family N-acetyltransferase [Radiobacillus kanasensis]